VAAGACGWCGGARSPAPPVRGAARRLGGRTRVSPLPVAGSSWPRVAASGRAAAPRPPGAHVALTVGRGRLGPRRAAARHTVRSVQGCSERPRACAPCPARDPRERGRQPRPSCSSRPLAACTSGTCPGSGAPRGVRVHRTARGGAARPPRRRSTCAPGRGEGLYVVLRPAQSRPARSARAWSARSGLPLGPRGWYPADSSDRPGVVGAEALRCAWVALLRARGLSVGYQGGWKARIAFWGPPPDLPLQDPVPAGGPRF
jgi:hypothetical protein